MSRTLTEPHLNAGHTRTHYNLTVHLSKEHLDRQQRYQLRRVIAASGGLKFSGQWSRRRAVDAAIAIKGKAPGLVWWVNVTRNTLQSIATVGKFDAT